MVNIFKSEKGNVFLYILLLIFLVIGLFYIFQTKYQLDSTLTQTATYSPAPNDETIEWEKLEIKDFRFSIKIPQDWHFSNNTISLEELPLQINPGRKYNIIRFTRQSGVIYSGYYVSDIFNVIKNLEVGKEYKRDIFNANDEKFIKVTSGKVNSGQDYIIYKVINNDNDNTDPNISALVLLNGQNAIAFNLTQYTDYGLEYFQKIIPTVEIK